MKQVKTAGEKYRSSVKKLEEEFLKEFADWLKSVVPEAKSFTFIGDDQCYNDEDYYTDLENFEINYESISENKPLMVAMLQDSNYSEEDDEWDLWEELKEKLKANCPYFIQEKTVKYVIK